jgi:predicted nucleotidyltransferase component of viral defense system
VDNGPDMKDKKITNIPASVKEKLRNVSSKTNIEFNTLLRKYFQERFLHRLSISKYKDSFILKGGLLLITIDTPATRPTMDIDFLAEKIKNDLATMAEIFKEIASIPLEDGIVFNLATIKTEVIKKEADYNGVRVKIEGNLGPAKQIVQVDLGFGDVIFPDKREILFPSILSEEKTKLKGYPLETVVSEKFEAMVKLGFFNSRMKDFYDIYNILTSNKIDAKKLKTAIKKTFENRGTIIVKPVLVFQKKFYNDPSKERQWSAYIRKSAIKTMPLPFKEVMLKIKEYLEPIII